jgi:spermidine dehydrogenase
MARCGSGDRDLGMGRAITRRDFLNGVSVTIGSTFIEPGEVSRGMQASRGSQGAPPSDGSYPPALTGMRGNHPGSMDAAHALRDGRTWEAGEDTGETYDLIVVGAGMSGLAAAHFFRKKTNPNARILILDNHDDFGGHARRNEFTVNGRLLIAKGGTQFLERLWTFTPEARELLQDIGIEYDDPSYKVDANVYSSLGLQASTFFDKETFGLDRLVPGFSVAGGGAGLAPARLAQVPISEQGRKDFARLWTEERDYLTGLSREEKIAKLKKTDYRTYLLETVNVDPDVLKVFHPNAQSMVPTHMASAWWAFNWGHPGFAGLGLEKAPDARENIDRNRPTSAGPAQFHFPEGNAGVARLLVRSLIPGALSATSMARAVMVPVKYARLDEPNSSVRLRLSSTVVRVRNNTPDPAVATEVEVSYVRQGKSYKVRGKGCVLACYNAVIPYMVPELPATQKEALSKAVRGVLVMTSVALRNWTAFQKLGVSTVTSPGPSYEPGYYSMNLTTPVNMGDYKAPRRPEEPIVLTLWGGYRDGARPGMTMRDYFRATRATVYATTFETFERRLRTHLERTLSEGGFDPARDIEGITINRWGHAMAMGQNLLTDPEWAPHEYPWVVGRRRFGRIAIANSDADGVPLTQAAFDQGYRAVYELTRPFSPWWNRV